MSLVAEIVGVLLAGWAIGWALQRRRLPVAARAAGVAVPVVAVAVIGLVSSGADLVGSFPAANRVDRAISAPAAELAAGAGTNTAFLAWARAQMVAAQRAPTFWMTPATADVDGFTNQWSTYQLLPARALLLPQRANWLVFYGVDPSTVPYDRAVFAPPKVFSPGYAVAERTHGD
jgi:hypothetical protein